MLLLFYVSISSDIYQSCWCFPRPAPKCEASPCWSQALYWWSQCVHVKTHSPSERKGEYSKKNQEGPYLSVICNRCTSRCSSVVVFWTRWLSFCSRFLYLIVSSVYCLLALSSSDVGTLPSRDFCNAAILNAAISWGQSKSLKSAEVRYSPQKRWPPSFIVKDQYIHYISKSIGTPPFNEQVFHSTMTFYMTV